jgi:hypothetical protein
MRDFAMDLVIAGLWVLALARVTRLVVSDRLTDFLRIWAYRRSRGAETMLTYFVQCPWCVSMWLGLGSSWAVFLLTGWDWWLYPLLSLAGSYAVGVLAENLEPDDDAEIEIVDDDQ